MARTVYIVISQTGTMLSMILKALTKAEYNHASISLDPKLDTMYSFGRLNPYNPFVGGFVTESPRYGTFKRFSKTTAIVLSMNVSEEQYAMLEQKLESMCANKKKYHYNYLGLFLAGIHIPYKQKRCYYCSEFVKEMLVRSNIRGAKDIDPIVKPIHFLHLPDTAQIYHGKLCDYGKEEEK